MKRKSYICPAVGDAHAFLAARPVSGRLELAFEAIALLRAPKAPVDHESLVWR